MANKLKTIAAKQKQETLVQHENEVAMFAAKVAQEVVGVLDNTDLKDSIAQLATNVAQSISISNHTLDLSLQGSFALLLDAVKLNKPNKFNEKELAEQIGVQLARMEETFKALELAPNITVEGLSLEDVRFEIGKIVDAMPADQKRVVTVAYEAASASQYLNVRLTDGISFYKASGGGGVTTIDTTFLAKEAKQDDLIVAVNNISGLTNYTTRIASVGSLTYIGNATIGASEAGAVWQIKRLDATSGLIKLWADGNDNYDNVWADRASLTYS